jgi:hypothetical protein
MIGDVLSGNPLAAVGKLFGGGKKKQLEEIAKAERKLMNRNTNNKITAET